MIRYSAPGKLMLLGEHAVVYGFPCLVTAIDKRISVDIHEGEEQNIRVHTQSNDTSFVDAAVAFFQKKYALPKKGLDMHIHASFPSTYGFGSSSAVTVASLAALFEYYAIQCSKQELFETAYAVVKSVQGTSSGFDVASAVYGGTLLYSQWGAHIKPLNWDVQSVSFLVAYSGQKADTKTLIKKVKRLYDTNPDSIASIFSRIADCVKDAETAFVQKEWEKLGSLLTLNHTYLKQLDVSTAMLDTIVSESVQSGAYGAKLSGAGGGDCAIVLTSNSTKENVVSSILDCGGLVIPVTMHAEGVRKEV